MIEIDASQGEGGGQVLRSSLSLSMITGQPVTLTGIRGGRPKPGLMRQHLACVQAAQAISSARVGGAELGSQQLRFEPGTVRAGSYRFEIATAGSCMLLLQTVWPALMLLDAPSELQLKGGTHNPMAPPFDFIAQAYAPLLARLGASASLQLRRAGFYPAGGGELQVRIEPATELQPFDLFESGATRSLEASCLAPGLARSIADRELRVLAEQLSLDAGQLLLLPGRQNEGPGNALMLSLEQEGVCELFCQLGEKGVAAESIAARLIAELQAYQLSGAALGPHLADQWLLPLALAVHRSGRPAGFSCSEWTPHAYTNAALIQRFLPLRIEAQKQATRWEVRLSPQILRAEPACAHSLGTKIHSSA